MGKDSLNWRYYFIIIAGLTFWSKWGNAATIRATSCSVADVSAAMNLAKSGDTIFVPAGVCTWTTPIDWAPLPNVSLIGAGDLSTIGGGNATVIVDSYASDKTLLDITVPSSGFVRFAGITFKGGNVGTIANTKWNGIVGIYGSGGKFRVDHITCDQRTYSPANSGRCFGIDGANGVVDHSLFRLPTNTGQPFMFSNSGGAHGDKAWAEDTGLGADRFIFIEDNTFESLTQYGGANDCNAGGRFVWRYNIMYSAGLQTHPTGGAGRGRGCRAWEIYGNKVYLGTSPEPAFNLFFLSSGTGVVWGNIVSGTKNFLTLHSMRKNNNTYSESPVPNGWGYCGTEFNGVGSPWDENLDPVTGAGCLDQPGRGKGDMLSGEFPNAINTLTGKPSWPNQALEPVYVWDNQFTPVPGWGGGFVSNYEPTALIENRDFYLQNSNFNGSSGVGSGPIANRPATCKTNVAYFAADQNTLYKCSGTNTWTAFYKPFTYPHPLVSGSSPTPTGKIIRSTPTRIKIF